MRTSRFGPMSQALRRRNGVGPRRGARDRVLPIMMFDTIVLRVVSLLSDLDAVLERYQPHG